jgi:hypothetical protein
MDIETTTDIYISMNGNNIVYSIDKNSDEKTQIFVHVILKMEMCREVYYSVFY